MRGPRHHTRRKAHRRADRRGQRCSSVLFGRRCVLGLVVLHLLARSRVMAHRRAAADRGGRRGVARPVALSRRRTPGSSDRRRDRPPVRCRTSPHTTADSAGWCARPVARVGARSRPGGRPPARRHAAMWARNRSSRAVRACAWYSAWAHTSPTWSTRINAPESLRSAGDRVDSSALGDGRAACAPPASVRNAWSAEMIHESSPMRPLYRNPRGGFSWVAAMHAVLSNVRRDSRCCQTTCDSTIRAQVFASLMPLWCNSRNFR